MLRIFVVLIIAAVVVAACGAQTAEAPPATPPEAQTPSGDTVHGEAIVDEIDILILESFPVQVNVVARGNLPDGCTEIDEIISELEGQTFNVTITTARPADAMCTEALVPFEETFSLDVYGLPAGVYTVDVNGVTGTFELAVDNAPQAEPGAPQTEPDAPGESPEVKPPPAMLTIMGQEQFSGIGSYCWAAPEGAEPSVAICADLIGIPTAEGPLAASSPFTASFQLEPEETPDELILDVIPVTAEDEMESWADGSRSWPYLPGERYTLSLEREPVIELSLEPGLYVLSLFGRWDALGYVDYGFLVDVQ
jgi:inhibitor of cysteine peptidase